MNRRFVSLLALAVSAALAAPVESFASGPATPDSAGATVLLGEVAAEALVTGLVVNHKGRPVDNYNVSAHDEDGVEVAKSLTYEGRYELWLPEGATVAVTGSDQTSPAVWADADFGRVSDVSGTVRLGRKQLLYVAPTMVREPALVGAPVVGNTVTADPGKWQHARAKDLVTGVEWLRGSKVVGTTTTYTVKAADLKKKLRFIVTVSGEHTAAATSKPVRLTVKQARPVVRLKKVTVAKKRVVVLVKVSGKKKQTVRLRTKAGKSIAKVSGRGLVKLTAPAFKKKQKKAIYFAGSTRLGWVKAVARR